MGGKREFSTLASAGAVGAVVRSQGGAVVRSQGGAVVRSARWSRRAVSGSTARRGREG